MRSFLLSIFAFLSLSATAQSDYAIVLHGGAGNGLQPKNIDDKRQQAYHKLLKKALQQGSQVLDSRGTAQQAVVASLQVLENAPTFNAGRGSVLTWQGQVSMDASLMDGHTGEAGAVAGVRQVKNPILAAQSVLQKSRHVLLSGTGADRFAREQNLEFRDSSYFIMPRRQKQLKRYRQRFGALPPTSNPASTAPPASQVVDKWGTVGCAALDRQGHVAAGTSTGGMMGKKHGRIGDSPIIGAGTYAHDSSIAVSCTGHGEYFIRQAVAHDLHARITYRSQAAKEAARDIIHQVLASRQASGGLIGITPGGEIIMEFNTEGMLRGYQRQGEAPVTAIFGE